jgi:nucleotide-binding universal stress UspA family protein
MHTPSKARAEAYSRILVTLDGSELAEEVLPHVEALARTVNATVTLLCVVSPAEPAFVGPTVSSHEAIISHQVMSVVADDNAMMTEQRRQEAMQYLATIEIRLNKEGLRIELECLVAQRPGEAIVEYGRHLGADLIAMTTRGRTGLGRTVLGSVADEVIRNVDCPVMVVRGGARD